MSRTPKQTKRDIEKKTIFAPTAGCRSENCFPAPFSQWIVLSGSLHSSYFRCHVAPQFSRDCGQKLRKVQKSAEKIVRTTSYR